MVVSRTPFEPGAATHLPIIIYRPQRKIQPLFGLNFTAVSFAHAHLTLPVLRERRGLCVGVTPSSVDEARCKRPAPWSTPVRRYDRPLSVKSSKTTSRFEGGGRGQEGEWGELASTG